jgi:hypothetical protein
MLLRTTLADRWRILLRAAGVLLWTALSAVPQASSSTDETVSARDRDACSITQAPPCATARPGAPQFRLGDAGLPFAWSTGVGDFNTDGRVDVAIIDRISRQSGLSSYRLEFAVSGLTADAVAFESEEESLTVSVSDVDRDSDLDVVVRSAPSGQTIGVWLNDGHGRFAPADVREFPWVGAQRAFAASSPSFDPWPSLSQTKESFGILFVQALPESFNAGQIVLRRAVARLSTDAPSPFGARAPPLPIALPRS